MKVTVKQEYGFVGRALEEDTFQKPFPATQVCVSCKADARPLVVINDDEGLISGQRPSGNGIWPHDSLAIALYLCSICGEITALWNQA